METYRFKVRGYSGPDYFVTATHVQSLFLTERSERIAWSGSAATYKDAKGGFYVSYHSGNGAHPETYYRITEKEFNTLHRLNSAGDYEGLREYIDAVTYY